MSIPGRIALHENERERVVHSLTLVFGFEYERPLEAEEILEGLATWSGRGSCRGKDADGVRTFLTPEALKGLRMHDFEVGPIECDAAGHAFQTIKCSVDQDHLSAVLARAAEVTPRSGRRARPGLRRCQTRIFAPGRRPVLAP